MIRAKTNNDLRKGVIDLSHPNPDRPVQDIIDLSFWNVDYRFMTNTLVEMEGSKTNSEGGSYIPSGVNVFGSNGKNRTSVRDLVFNSDPPNIWFAVDGLAKAFYSTIMTDLGQTTATPNILLN
ncbi:MAG: hypothetical protein Q9218_007676 [Villophora microphyllina]